MTKFEVGKSYALHLPAKYDGKATFITDIYTVTKRTPCYLTFSHISHDGTKMPHCRCKIFTSDSRGEFVHATAFFCLYADSHIDDDSQHELPATADDAISATNNDSALASQPADDASTESETNAQLEIVKFIIGKTFSRETVVGIQRFIINGRQSDIVQGMNAYVWFKFFPLTDSRFPRHEKRKIFIGKDKNGVLSEYFRLGGKSDKVFASQFANIQPATAESSQPEALYDDDSYSDDPGDNSCPDMDIPGEYVPDDTEKKQEFFADDSYMRNKPYVAVRYVFKVGHKFCDYDGIVYTVISRSKSFITFRNNHGKLIRRKPYGYVCVDSSRHAYAESVYIGDNHYRAKCKSLNAWQVFIPDEVQTEIPAPADNPGFTIVPSEHIERPQYTTYPDTIIDECPYTTVYACDIPENTENHNSAAAVVPYSQAATIRNFLRLIAIYLRLWFASHIIPADFVFPVKISHSYFSVGFKYPAWINHKKQFLTVTDRKILDNGRLLVSVNDEENGSFHFTPIRDQYGCEYTYFPVWNEFCYASQGVRVKRRSNAIKFNLGLTYPALRNHEFYGNATVIAFDDIYSKDKNGKIKLTHHDVIFKTDCEEKSFKHIQTWTRIENGVELAEYNVYPPFKFSADCPSLGSKSPELPNITPLAVFSVGCDYSLEVYGKKYSVHITARTKNTVSFSCDMLKAKHPEDTRIFTTPITVDAESKSEMLYLLGDCRADKPDFVQVIPAETRDITPKSRKPESAPSSATVHADIEHKLIDTKDLHFAEKRKALEHNTTVITSCMFSEAVISLLMSISAKAVIQLGFHMGLFIAKPKGSKKAIAESFAERLITRRDIHANVRTKCTKSANTAANNSPNVPDGVKIFVGARRQICFKFED